MRFLRARATLCGDRRGRGAKTRVVFFLPRFLAVPARPSRGSAWSRCKIELEVFCVIFAVPARSSAGRRGRGAKTQGFLRSLRCPRDPLRVVVKLVVFCDFLRCPRDPLRGSVGSRCKNSRVFLRFFLRCPRDPLGIVRSRRDAVRFLLLAQWPLEVVSWFARLLSQSRGRGFDSDLVRGSSGLKIAAFKYKRSTRSVLLQLRLENRNL